MQNVEWLPRRGAGWNIAEPHTIILDVVLFIELELSDSVHSGHAILRSSLLMSWPPAHCQTSLRSPQDMDNPEIAIDFHTVTGFNCRGCLLASCYSRNPVLSGHNHSVRQSPAAVRYDALDDFEYRSPLGTRPRRNQNLSGQQVAELVFGHDHARDSLRHARSRGTAIKVRLELFPDVRHTGNGRNNRVRFDHFPHQFSIPIKQLRSDFKIAFPFLLAGFDVTLQLDPAHRNQGFLYLTDDQEVNILRIINNACIGKAPPNFPRNPPPQGAVVKVEIVSMIFAPIPSHLRGFHQSLEPLPLIRRHFAEDVLFGLAPLFDGLLPLRVNGRCSSGRYRNSDSRHTKAW